MRPLSKLEVKDLNLEIEKIALRPLETLVVIRSFKKGKCYGIGFNPSDLILRNRVRITQSEFKPYPLAGAVDVTLVDVGGNNRTCRCQGAYNWLAYGDGFIADVGTKLAYGNPASTPTPARTDYCLASEVARINPSATSIDETNWRVVVTGSHLWTAGGTVREAGMFVRGGISSGPVFYDFLIYHDAVSDVAVPAGGTVSVTYTTQF